MRSHEKPFSPQARAIVRLATRGAGHAEKALWQLEADALPVVEELLASTRQPPWHRKFWIASLPMWLTPPVVLYLSGLPQYHGVTQWLQAYLWLALMPGFFVALLWRAILESIVSYRRQNDGLHLAQDVAITYLINCQDPRAVGLLLEIVERRERLTRTALEAARYALVSHLSRLHASQAHALTYMQRDCLYWLLMRHSAFLLRAFADGHEAGEPNSEWDEPLAVAILRAYEFLGDARALVQVEQLTESLFRDKTRAAKRVHEAASRCYAPLLANTERLRRGEGLLRPSAAEPVRPDELVRPVAPQPPEAADVLLRPHSEE